MDWKLPFTSNLVNPMKEPVSGEKKKKAEIMQIIKDLRDAAMVSQSYSYLAHHFLKFRRKTCPGEWQCIFINSAISIKHICASHSFLGYIVIKTVKTNNIKVMYLYVRGNKCYE